MKIVSQRLLSINNVQFSRGVERFPEHQYTMIERIIHEPGLAPSGERRANMVLSSRRRDGTERRPRETSAADAISRK